MNGKLRLAYNKYHLPNETNAESRRYIFQEPPSTLDVLSLSGEVLKGPQLLMNCVPTVSDPHLSALATSHSLGLDIGRITPNVFGELQQFSCKLDVRLEEVLCIQAIGLGVACVLLDVESDRCTAAASA